MLSEISSCLGGIAESDTETVDSILGKKDADICPLIEQFRLEGIEASPLFQFCDDYLTKVSEPKVVPSIITHSTWESDHYSKCKRLPFFFAANRSTYAKYMTYMILTEKRLPEKVITSFT